MARNPKKNHKMGKSDQTLTKSPSFSPDELMFQPWFLPKRVAFAIRALAPPDYHLKMRHFFDDYGCMICKKDHDYGSNGMCRPCCMSARKKLARSVRIRLKPKSQRRFALSLIRQANLAKKLLRRFSPENSGTTTASSFYRLRPINPVDEALGPHSQRVRS